MTLATTEPLKISGNGARVIGVSNTAPWKTVISAGGMDGADNSGNPITLPDTQITQAANRIFFFEEERGTYLSLRMGYDDGSDASDTSQQCVIELFGRKKGSSDAWQLLANRAGDVEVELTVADTDSGDGTLEYTSVHPENHVFDTLGCDEFLVGIEIPLVQGTGNEALAILQAKAF